MTTAGTEYSVVFPENTNKFMIRTRELSVLKVGKSTGDTGTNYITVKKGNAYIEDRLLLTTIVNRTMYISSTKNNDTLEVIAWV